MALLPNAGIQAFVSSAKNKIEHFLSGFAGYGWKIWEWTTGRYKLEIDDLTVRKTMTVYELIISKIRSIVGAMAITQAHGKIKSVDSTSDQGNYLITLEDTNSFVEYDFIRMQEWTGGQRSYWVQVSEIRGETVVISKSEFDSEISTPQIGDEIVQFGNQFRTERQSAIYLHADETGQPAIDVMFGINSKSFDGKVKLRLGAGLPGVSDEFKGLYAENGMLKFTDDKGSVTSQIWPDGTAELGAGAMKVNPDKSGYIGGENGLSWHWDTAKDRFVCEFGSDAVLKWSNLADEVKENLKGETGAYYVYVYQSAATQPAKPIGTTLPPDGWSLTPTSPSATDHVWMAQAKANGDGNIEGWSTPVRISGENGKKGADGTDVEFIYRRTESVDEELEMPETSQEDDFVPTGWTNHPEGVTSMYLYEWVSVRYKNDGIWSEFTLPVVWAKWGEKGTDGDGVEYVYKLTDILSPPAAPENFQEDEHIPDEEWTDDPTGVSSTYPYEWVCVRKKTDGVWGEFSKPVLWAKYGEDGKKGDDANLLPWVEEWNNNKTLIEDEYVVSPKMFSGTKNDDETLTGVALGHGVVTLDGIERSGLFGLKDGKLTFEIDAKTGDAIFSGQIKIADNKILLNPDGSGQLANGSILWDTAGNTTLVGKFETFLNGRRICINPLTNSFKMFNENGTEIVTIDFYIDSFVGLVSMPRIIMRSYGGYDGLDLSNELRITSGSIRIDSVIYGKELTLSPVGGLIFYENGVIKKQYPVK